MSSLKLKHRLSLWERVKSGLKTFSQVKLGMVGVGIICGFGVLALLAPIYSPTYPGMEFYSEVGPPWCSPFWLAPLDVLNPPSGNYIPDSSFTQENSWDFISTDPANLTYSFDPVSYVTGSQSVRFQISDTSINQSHNDEVVRAFCSFNWSYNPPSLLELSFWWKVRIQGNLTENSIIPYLYLKEPQDGTCQSHYGRVEFRSGYPSEWNKYERKYMYLLVYYLFQPGANIYFEFGVECVEREPSRVGTAEVWFDQIELRGQSNYLGPLGTNAQGQDVLAQLLWAIPVSLYVGILSALATVGIGGLAGLIAGFKGGKYDIVLMRIADFFLMLPVLIVLMILLSTSVVKSYNFLIVFIALLSWPRTARVIRSQVLVEKEKDYIEAAKVAGGSDYYIIFRHIIPNVLTLIFAEVALAGANAILLEAGLALFEYPFTQQEYLARVFLAENTITWGRMLASAFWQHALGQGAWWVVIPPGICIGLLTIGFVFSGYGVDLTFNPKLRDARQQRDRTGRI